MKRVKMQGAGIASLALALCLAGSAVAAPLDYNGGVYTQDFDGLPTAGSTTLTGKGPHYINGVLGTTGLEGWQIANPGGSSANTEFRAQDGSQAGSGGRGAISFGTTGSSERALGALPTSNQISHFGLVMVNNTANVLNQFTLSYTGEQWRRGDVSTANVLGFSYEVGAGPIDIGSGGMTFVNELSFTSPNMQAAPTEVALDGNHADNQTLVLGTVTGLNWQPGESLVLRWAIQDLTGQDNGLAIDNLSFVAQVPEPSSVMLAIAGMIGVAAMTYRRRMAQR